MTLFVLTLLAALEYSTESQTKGDEYAIPS
jgi:hypothetical protein